MLQLVIHLRAHPARQQRQRMICKKREPCCSDIVAVKPSSITPEWQSPANIQIFCHHSLRYFQ